MNTRVTPIQMYEYSKSFDEAYQIVMHPLVEELKMPQTAVDILLFLANNPEQNTAGEICKYRHLKPGIVSFQVEKLVGEGLLERRAVEGDRRKCKLVCTGKAVPIIEKGRILQKKFISLIEQGLSEEEMKVLERCILVFTENFEKLKQEDRKSKDKN